MDDHAKNVLILWSSLHIILKQLILNSPAMDDKTAKIC